MNNPHKVVFALGERGLVHHETLVIHLELVWLEHEVIFGAGDGGLAEGEEHGCGWG